MKNDLMRAIKIDYKKKEVYLVEVDGSLNSILDQLECSHVDHAVLYRPKRGPNRQEDLWVDDEGLINGTDGGFKLRDRGFAGHGLILGHNYEGASVSSEFSIDIIKQDVTFISKSELPEPTTTVITF